MPGENARAGEIILASLETKIGNLRVKAVINAILQVKTPEFLRLFILFVVVNTKKSVNNSSLLYFLLVYSVLLASFSYLRLDFHFGELFGCFGFGFACPDDNGKPIHHDSLVIFFTGIAFFNLVLRAVENSIAVP